MDPLDLVVIYGSVRSSRQGIKIVCYSAGPFGGVRAAMQLRAMLCELGTPSIPTLLPVPKVQDVFDDDDGRPLDDAYPRRAERFLGELEWYAHALKAARQAGVPH